MEEKGEGMGRGWGRLIDTVEKKAEG